MQADGVHGAKPSSFPANTPAQDRSVMPSMSFSLNYSLTERSLMPLNENVKNCFFDVRRKHNILG